VKRLSVEHRLLGAFVTGALLLAWAAWFALASGRDYLDASGRADRLADAARATAALLVDVEKAASTQRGYLITGDDQDLAAFLRAPAAALGDLARVQAVLDGDAEAALHLERLAAQIPARLAELRPPVAARTESVEAALRSVATGDGDIRIEGLRAEVRALDDLVTLRTREARERAHAHAERARQAVWTLGVLVIMLFSGAYAIIIGNLRERRRLDARLRQAANHDGPTGLPNRRFFGEWLAYSIAHARREVRHVGLLFIDVDGLRTVDELHGRASADALLVEIARRFRETAREGDVLARIGASQFALAVPNVGDPRDVAPLAQRLRDSLTDPARPPLADTPIGASVGVAFYPDDADDPAGVMAAADAAMYAAKGAGKNHVVINALAQPA
jgi:diguanylate cyclase (GGDEF)-like protein